MAMEIVEEVAERERVDPEDLTPPLHDSIDAEALDALFTDSVSGARRDGIHLSFTYCGYRIEVAEGREIEIVDE